MATKRQRGRDPEQSEILTAGAEANNYRGLLGQMTVTRTPGVGLTGIAVHDGTTPGGTTIALPAPGVAQDYPTAVIVPSLSVTLVDAVPLTVTHSLGYFPVVQVVNADTLTVMTDVTVVHVDFNSFTLTRAVGRPVIVLMR